MTDDLTNETTTGPTTDDRGIRSHWFWSSGGAYNRSQTEDQIRDGDVLFVPAEGRVAVLVEAWPVIVAGPDDEDDTFHALNPDLTWRSFRGGRYNDAAIVAIAVLNGDDDLARAHGWTGAGYVAEGIGEPDPAPDQATADWRAALHRRIDGGDPAPAIDPVTPTRTEIDPAEIVTIETDGETYDVVVTTADGTGYVVEATGDRDDAETVAAHLRAAFSSWMAVTR